MPPAISSSFVSRPNSILSAFVRIFSISNGRSDSPRGRLSGVVEFNGSFGEGTLLAFRPTATRRLEFCVRSARLDHSRLCIFCTCSFCVLSCFARSPVFARESLRSRQDIRTSLKISVACGLPPATVTGKISVSRLSGASRARSPSSSERRPERGHAFCYTVLSSVIINKVIV